MFCFQAAVEEFEQVLEQVHSKGVEDEEVAQKAARALRDKNKTPSELCIGYLCHFCNISLTFCCKILSTMLLVTVHSKNNIHPEPIVLTQPLDPQGDKVSMLTNT